MEHIRLPLSRVAGSAAALLAATATLLLPLAAQAQEVTLRAINSFQEGTYFARQFEAFVKKVNDEGKGIVQINYIGGPKAIPTMEQGAALRSGVVDLANTTAAYIANLVPEALALNYATRPFSEIRKNGGLDYLNKLMQEKGLYYLAKTGDNIQYHIYLNKKVDKPDLSGLKIRIAPIFRDFFTQLGATVVQTAPGEVYTALDRGVVDGYGWPAIGIFDLGWHEKTKYRIDPGFYTLELGIQFNAKKWASLTPPQRAFIEKMAAWVEETSAAASITDAATDLKKQGEVGIETIKFNDAQAAQYLKTSQDAGWAAIEKASPTHGPKLRELLSAK
ncbi:MAG: TRAP transporter substrate-binding protein DctP [Lautropia sp.]